MAIKSICYRRDSGVVVACMPTDHIWSAIEQGLQPYNGITFAVVNMDITDDQISNPDAYVEGEPFNCNPCIYCHKLKVDDVDNPTSLVEV